VYRFFIHGYILAQAFTGSRPISLPVSLSFAVYPIGPDPKPLIAIALILHSIIISFRPAWLARALLSLKRAQSSGND